MSGLVGSTVSFEWILARFQGRCKDGWLFSRISVVEGHLDLHCGGLPVAVLGFHGDGVEGLVVLGWGPGQVDVAGAGVDFEETVLVAAGDRMVARGFA